VKANSNPLRILPGIQPRPVTLVLGALLLFIGLPLCAQSPAQPHVPAQPAAAPKKLYRIAGVVTDSITGEPVPRATVSLLNDDSEAREQVESSETDDDGAFALPPVPVGKYGLRVARRGYLVTFFDEHDEYSSAIVTGEGQDSENIPFQLKPDAMVHGVVTDDAGEPVQQAQVLLVRKSRAGGLGEHMVKSISGATDDTGSYEFWNLLPGMYFLAVKSVPWFALNPTMSGRGPRDAQAQQNAAALDVAYPVTYYDGVTDEASATPVTISSGDRVELNVALHAVPAIHLAVRGGVDGPGIRPPMLRQSIFGDDELTAAAGMYRGALGPGTAEIAGIAPGHYELSQGNPPRITELNLSGSGSQDVDSSAGTATVTVTVKAQMADGSPLPSPLALALRPDNAAQREITSRMTSKGDLRFDSVPPGSFALLPQSGSLALAVVSIQSGGSAGQDSRIQVGEHPLSLTVTLAKGATDVIGFARDGGKGKPGVMVVLIPQNPAANLSMFRRDQSDSDGSFRLREVAPGQYTVVAIEDGWELEWARTEVIRRYLPRGIPVTVSGNSSKRTILAEPVPVQSR